MALQAPFFGKREPEAFGLRQNLTNPPPPPLVRTPPMNTNPTPAAKAPLQAIV